MLKIGMPRQVKMKVKARFKVMVLSEVKVMGHAAISWMLAHMSQATYLVTQNWLRLELAKASDNEGQGQVQGQSCLVGQGHRVVRCHCMGSCT